LLSSISKSLTWTTVSGPLMKGMNLNFQHITFIQSTTMIFLPSNTAA
jgi:hypothetical protein